MENALKLKDMWKDWLNEDFPDIRDEDIPSNVVNQGTRYHHPETQEEALQNLDRYVSLKYHYLDMESSHWGNMMDLKKFVRNAIMEFLIKERYQHDGKLDSIELSNLISREINFTKANHSKERKNRKQPANNKVFVERSVVKKTYEKSNQGKELMWKVKNLDIRSVIMSVINKTDLRIEIQPAEKTVKAQLIQVPWKQDDQQDYIAKWMEIVEKEKQLSMAKNQKQRTKGTITQRTFKATYITVSVPEDTVIDFGWDKNDYVLFAPYNNNNNGERSDKIKAIIKNISLRDDAADCELTIKLTRGQNAMILLEQGDTIEIQKQESLQVYQKWLSALQWYAENTFAKSGIARCIITNEESLLVRTEVEASLIINKLFACSEQSSAIHKLNEIQRNLLIKAVSNRFTMLMGHPGTGKTEWICALLHCLSHFPEVKKVLITAPTNAAIDVVCLAFLEKYSSSIARPCPLQVELPERLEPFRVTKSNASQLDSATFVFSTCVHSAGNLVASQNFNVVIVDEASQSPEPDLLCALAGRTVEQLILVGDPFQNRPIALSDNSNLKRSAMERLFSQGKPVHKLTTQYRMLPELANIPRQFVYEQYEDSPLACTQGRLELPFWKDYPCWFLHINSAEVRDSSGSFWNYTSCRNVATIVDILLADGRIKPDQIGVIDGYRLDKLLLESILLELAKKRADEVGETEISNMPHLQVAINTIDGFQGGQRDLIILCTVRSNSEHTIGFLDNIQRFNVATTRAKKGLLIVGDFFTLFFSTNQIWKKFLYDLARDKHIIFGIDEFRKEIPTKLWKKRRDYQVEEPASKKHQNNNTQDPNQIQLD